MTKRHTATISRAAAIRGCLGNRSPLGLQSAMLTFMKVLNSLVLAAAALAMPIGCSSPNHDLLAVKDASPSGLVDAGHRDASDVTDAPVDVADRDADATPSPEGGSHLTPDGASRVVFVHGIVDTRNVLVCLEERTSPDQGDFLAGAPMPTAGGEGLAYGGSTELIVPAGFKAAPDDVVRPVVFFGNLGAIASRDCSDLRVLPDDVERRNLPWIPASVFQAGRLVVLVAAGCEASSDGADAGDDWKLACGSEAGGNLTLLAASPSRVTRSDAIGTQVFHASIASSSLSLQYHASSPNYVVKLASSVQMGGLSPSEPMFELTRQALGLDPDQGIIEVLADPPSVEPSETIPLTDALRKGDLTLDELQDGSSFVLVAVGPAPGVKLSSRWQPFTTVFIRTDGP